MYDFQLKYSSFKIAVVLKFKSSMEYGLWFVSWFHLSFAFCGSAVLQQIRQFQFFCAIYADANLSLWISAVQQKSLGKTWTGCRYLATNLQGKTVVDD
jgi:hypothetical protein